MRSNPHPVGSFLHGIVGHESMAACHLEELLRCEWPQLGSHQPAIPLGRHGTSLAKSEKRKGFADEGYASFYSQSRANPTQDRSQLDAFWCWLPCGARLLPSISSRPQRLLRTADFVDPAPF